MLLVFFVFFRQKTAYEMRISDWSSDVCSSDLVERVCVMYAGRLVEEAPAAALFARPRHPYTRGLLAALPALDGPRQRLAAIPGSVPEPWNLPAGCAFAPRCAEADEACHHQPPPDVPVSRRSEEHTSELKHLMRISYAVFFLKNK